MLKGDFKKKKERERIIKFITLEQLLISSHRCLLRDLSLYSFLFDLVGLEMVAP
jgi:hypothetical protein